MMTGSENSLAIDRKAPPAQLAQRAWQFEPVRLARTARGGWTVELDLLPERLYWRYLVTRQWLGTMLRLQHRPSPQPDQPGLPSP